MFSRWRKKSVLTEPYTGFANPNPLVGYPDGVTRELLNPVSYASVNGGPTMYAPQPTGQYWPGAQTYGSAAVQPNVAPGFAHIHNPLPGTVVPPSQPTTFATHIPQVTPAAYAGTPGYGPTGLVNQNLPAATSVQYLSQPATYAQSVTSYGSNYNPTQTTATLYSGPAQQYPFTAPNVPIPIGTFRVIAPLPSDSPTGLAAGSLIPFFSLVNNSIHRLMFIPQLAPDTRNVLNDLSCIISDLEAITTQKGGAILLGGVIGRGLGLARDYRNYTPPVGPTATGIATGLTKETSEFVKSLYAVGLLIATDPEGRTLMMDLLRALRDLSTEAYYEMREKGPTAFAQGIREAVLPTTTTFRSSAPDTFHPSRQVMSQAEFEAKYGPLYNTTDKPAIPLREWVETRGTTVEGIAGGDSIRRNVSFAQNTQQYRGGSSFNEVRADSLYAFRNLLVALSRKQEWKNLINHLFALAAVMGGVTESGKSYIEVLKTNPRYHMMLGDFKMFMNSLVGVDTYSRFSDSWSAFFYKLSSDPIRINWWKDFSAYVSRVLENPSWAESLESRQTLSMLTERSTLFAEDIKSIFDATSAVFAKVSADPVIAKFYLDVTKLFRDLTMNETGQFTFKDLMLRQMRELLVPFAVETIRGIRLTRIEGATVSTGGPISWAIENLNFAGVDIVPDNTHISIINDLDLDINRLTTYGARTAFYIRMSGINAALNDVGFAFTRLKGPFQQDQGLANIVASGISVEMMVDYFGLWGRPVLAMRSVNVSIPVLNVKTRFARHSFIYNTFSSLFNARLKNVIKTSVEQQLVGMVNNLNMRLIQLSDLIPRQTIGGMIMRTMSGISGAVAPQFQKMKTSLSKKAKKALKAKKDKTVYAYGTGPVTGGAAYYDIPRYEERAYSRPIYEQAPIGQTTTTYVSEPRDILEKKVFVEERPTYFSETSMMEPVSGLYKERIISETPISDFARYEDRVISGEGSRIVREVL